MRWLLLLLPALCTCAQPKRREVTWPAPDPRDGCFAGHAAEANLPAVDAAIVISPKGLKDEDVRRGFRARAQEMKSCFGPALAGRPPMSGTVRFRFTVSEDGTVRRSEIERTTLRYPELEACLGRSICRWRFTPPSTGEVTVSYPMVFTGSR